MIIKRVGLGEESQQALCAQAEKKSATPRVIIKMKKTLKVQPCQQLSEENIQEGENNYFNDTDYFNHHHQFMQGQKEHEETISHQTHIQQVRTRPKQTSSESRRIHQLPLAARQDPIRSLFLQFLKKEPFQAAKSSALQYPQINYSERQRKYSCGSNRKDIAELPGPVLFKSHHGQKQADSIRQLPDWDLKLNKSNNSCCVVNPYTQKEYFHQRVTQTSNNQRLKKFKSLDYSIIKPNQIKAVPLSNRNEEKNGIPKRKHERKQFPQLIAALKRKEELWAQRSREQRDQMRVMMHTSYLNRRKAAVADEPNELLPWEVEGQPNLADII